MVASSFSCTARENNHNAIKTKSDKNKGISFAILACVQCHDNESRYYFQERPLCWRLQQLDKLKWTHKTFLQDKDFLPSSPAYLYYEPIYSNIYITDGCSHLTTNANIVRLMFWREGFCRVRRLKYSHFFARLSGHRNLHVYARQPGTWWKIYNCR